MGTFLPPRPPWVCPRSAQGNSRLKSRETRVTDLLRQPASSPVVAGIAGKLLSSEHLLSAAVGADTLTSGRPLRGRGRRFQVPLGQARVRDDGLRRAGLQEALQGPFRFVQLTLDPGSQGVNRPTPALGQCPELAEGDARGAVHTLRQRHVAVIALQSESGIAELRDQGGLAGCWSTGHETSRSFRGLEELRDVGRMVFA
jgi:hypothetical protein